MQRELTDLCLLLHIDSSLYRGSAKISGSSLLPVCHWSTPDAKSVSRDTRLDHVHHDHQLSMRRLVLVSTQGLTGVH